MKMYSLPHYWHKHVKFYRDGSIGIIRLVAYNLTTGQETLRERVYHPRYVWYRTIVAMYHDQLYR